MNSEMDGYPAGKDINILVANIMISICRVPVKPCGFGLSTKDKPRVVKKLKFDKEFEVNYDNSMIAVFFFTTLIHYQKSIKHLYKKEKRFPCPDCEAVGPMVCMAYINILLKIIDYNAVVWRRHQTYST